MWARVSERTRRSPVRLLSTLLVVCVGLIGSASGTSPAAAASKTLTRKVAGVFTAGGQRQYINCQGSGGPTAVLISGQWGWSKDWSVQANSWRKSGRVCVYDRPGLGRSDVRRGTSHINAGTHAKELYALLRAAGERGPFLLVGHSYGGLIARAFTRKYRTSVKGVLLLDAVPPGIQSAYAPYEKTFDEPKALISLAASSTATGYGKGLAGIRVIVLSAEDPDWDPQKMIVWNAGQDDAARASGKAIRLTAINAGHELQQTAPAAVDKAFRVLRSGLRGANFRPGCHLDWTAVNARCKDLN